MKQIFTLLSLFIIIGLFAFSISNINISGIINSYAAVTNISDGVACSSILDVDDTNGFSVGDYCLLIQMQGAEIDETNSANFGNINNLNSAGLHEKIQISAINGNQITTAASLLYSYQIEGKVQIVRIATYEDATITDDVVAMDWNGSKGGIIAMEVSGTLTLQANISADSSGFRGGKRAVASSSCSSFTFLNDYYYPINSWESEKKGEGIALRISGKELGRGAQANGGGGGNDHNSGGGGGAGFSIGGRGGENIDSGLFNCQGSYPGEGGKIPSFSDQRLFLGGGGGAGHDNNDAGSDGGQGGGIIFISANAIEGNNYNISADGQNVMSTISLDGGGGGGGGGSIILENNSINSNVIVNAQGGKGSDVSSKNQQRCMGPGGGGGGGIIYTNVTTMITANTNGGIAGIITNSSGGCNGSNNNAQAGGNGMLTSLISLPENIAPEIGSETYTGCPNDGYSIVVNNTTYDITNPTGQEIIVDGAVNGCDSIVDINLTFHPAMSISHTQDVNNITIHVVGGTAPFSYSWSNTNTGEMNELNSSGNYTVTVTDANGCNDIYDFSFQVTSLEDIKNDLGISVMPNPANQFLILEALNIQENTIIFISDISGKKIWNTIWNGNILNIDTQQFSNGIYLLSIQSEKKIYTGKISIIH